MDNEDCTPQPARRATQSSDDHVGGCCSIFNRPRRRNVYRHPLFRPRTRERSSKKVLPKGTGRKSPEGTTRKADDHVGTPPHGDTDFLQTTPLAGPADAENEESQRTINNAIIALNKTVNQFYDTLGEFAELGRALDNDSVRIRGATLGPSSLDEGIALVSSVIHKMIGEQKQESYATSLKRGALPAIGRGFIIICRSINPALKNLLTVAAPASAVSHSLKDYPQSINFYS